MRFLTIILAASMACAQTTKVFQLTQHEDAQDLRQIGDLLHFVAGVQPSSTDEGLRTLTVNAPDSQVATADWLIHQLDLPADSPFTGVYEYRPSGASDDVLRVFYLTHVSGPRDIQEIATSVRLLASIHQLGVYNALKVLAVRGAAQQVALAAWLVDHLNQSAGAAAAASDQFK